MNDVLRSTAVSVFKLAVENEAIDVVIILTSLSISLERSGSNLSFASLLNFQSQKLLRTQKTIDSRSNLSSLYL
jgi:hypothetical protein